MNSSRFSENHYKLLLWWTGSACFQWGGDWVLMLFGWISYSKVIVKHIKKGRLNDTWQQNVWKNENNVAKTYEERNTSHGTNFPCRCVVWQMQHKVLYTCWWSMSWHSACYKTNDLYIRNVRSDTIFTATYFGCRQSFSWTHSWRQYCVIVYVLCVQVVGFITWIKIVSHCMEWRQTSKCVVKTCVV